MTDQGIQTDLVPVKKKAKNRKSGISMRQTMGEAQPMAMRKPKPMVADAEALKKQARANLVKPQYNVFDDYWETGMFQAIAKSKLFENITFGVIIVNSMWIGVDLDNNSADVLTDAHPIFIVAENLFCAFFSFEVVC